MQARIVCSLLLVSAVKIRLSQADEISQWAFGLRSLLESCSPATRTVPGRQRLLPTLRHCMQNRALMALDFILMEDVIPVLKGISLVRYEDRLSNSTEDEFMSEATNNVGGNDGHKGRKDWQELLVSRLIKVFRSHVLQIHVDQISKATWLSTATPEEEFVEDVVEGRRRRHRHKAMLPMMMMGVLFMGTVLIPMGFQFLAVLGGKALILAKMALMMSSVQGLKKIAKSGFNYGLYHSPSSEGWYERSHQEHEGHSDLPYYSHHPGVHPIQ